MAPPHAALTLVVTAMAAAEEEDDKGNVNTVESLTVHYILSWQGLLTLKAD